MEADSRRERLLEQLNKAIAACIDNKTKKAIDLVGILDAVHREAE